MTTAERTESTVEDIAQQARTRQAQERLYRFEEMRNAAQLEQAGMTQREIADILGTTQPRVGRLLHAARSLGAAETPEEIILRATLKQISREELVEQLRKIDYTFTEFAPYPHEGSVPGTWTQVRTAHRLGLLSDEEYENVSAAVKPPPSE